MEELRISNQQIKEFASSCFEVIIREIKDAQTSKDTSVLVAEKPCHPNAA